MILHTHILISQYKNGKIRTYKCIKELILVKSKLQNTQFDKLNFINSFELEYRIIRN